MSRRALCWGRQVSDICRWLRRPRSAAPSGDGVAARPEPLLNGPVMPRNASYHGCLLVLSSWQWQVVKAAERGSLGWRCVYIALYDALSRGLDDGTIT
jgi:hypothetical protein